ncbi:MAG: GNAT family N-acetyltransferase [Paludibacteraceae bacterium]
MTFIFSTMTKRLKEKQKNNYIKTMNIIYKETKDLNPKDLQDLFLSVEWSSGHYPEKLAIAMQNSSTVYTAWDEDKLVGLINVLDDNIMTAYIHYLLINPKFQGKGIGKNLVNYVKAKYKDYLRIVLIAYDKEAPFYQNLGFEIGDEKLPMFITSLWT